MPRRLRAVSLDLDNTLWDTAPVLVRAEAALGEWLEAHAPLIARQFDLGDFRRMRIALASEQPGRAHDLSWLRTETLRRAAAVAGYPAAVAEQAFEVFLEARNTIELYPDVADALRRLARHVPLFALTNGNACVHRVGIGEHFAGALDAAGAGAPKPDRRIYTRLVALAAARPAEILHVGDDALADVDGARAAGLGTVWMNRSGEDWPAGIARADHEVRDLAALAELVESLL